MITGNEPINQITGHEGTPYVKTSPVDKDMVENEIYSGLTIRQHFAAMAMQAILTDYQTQKRICDIDPRYDGDNFASVVAINACEFADTLINQLNKEK